MKSSISFMTATILVLAVSCSSRSKYAEINKDLGKDVTSSDPVDRNSIDDTRYSENRTAGRTTASQIKDMDSNVEVTRKIRDRLTDMDGLSVRAQNITIVTSRNDVTLKGTVAKKEEIQKIMSLTREIASDREISNQLRVHK